MFTACHPLILASASPRRQEFLRQLGLAFRAEPARIDETPETGEPAAAFARRMAITKAKAIAATSPQACVIGADTVVTLDETLFGKPRDREEALAILKQLQGRTHRVITGFAVCCHDRRIEEAGEATTLVTFDHFADSVLQAYVDSGEPMDKAGAYGIQGRGAFLVRTINGSYSNVVGLPINVLVQLLLRHHMICVTGAPCRSALGQERLVLL